MKFKLARILLVEKAQLPGIFISKDEDEEMDEKRKKSKFARAILKKKPLFDSSKLSF